MRPSHRIIAIIALLTLSACSQSTPSAAPSTAATIDSSLQPEVLATQMMPVEVSPEESTSASPTVEAPAAPPTPELPAFAGLWTNDQGEVLALSPSWIYHRFEDNDAVYEHFSTVQGFDTQAGEIDYRLGGIRLNGEGVGFDYPMNKAVYQIDQDAITYSVLVDPADPSAGIRYSTTLTRAFQADETPNAAPPSDLYQGIWINPSGEVLYLSENVFYHRFNSKNSTCPLCVYEHIAQVASFDALHSNLEFYLRRIRIDGSDGSFDAPQNLARLTIDQEILYYNEFVDPADPLTGIRYAAAFTRAID